MRSRRSAFAIVLLVLAGLALNGCGSGGSAGSAGADGDRRVLKMAVQEPYSAFLMHVAKSQGYFDGSSIEGFETTTFTSLPSMLTAVQKGQMDFGMQTVAGLAAFNSSTSGAPLYTFSNYGNGIYWYTGEGSPVPPAAEAGLEETVTAMRGSTIGVAALGGIMDKQLRYMLEEQGLNPDSDVEITAVGSQQSAEAAYKQGLVDVVGVTGATAGMLELAGSGRRVLDDSTTAEPFRGNITGAFFAPKDAIDEDPELYRDVAEAMAQARQFIADPANREAAVDVLVEDIGLQREVAEKTFDIDMPSITAAGIDQEVFDRTIHGLVLTGLMPETVAYEDMVATEVLAE
jgi:NitT/TauT family transport system substrate-binding protein